MTAYKTIPLTKGQFAKVDSKDWEELSKHKWHYNQNGYAGRWIGGRKNQRYIYMHRQIMEFPDGKNIDHIDGDKLNNKRSNLRTATHRENLRNRGPTKANRYGYKCIYWDKPRKKWSVRVNVDGKLAYLGRYKDLADAIIKRDSFLKNYHGEYFRV